MKKAISLFFFIALLVKPVIGFTQDKNIEKYHKKASKDISNNKFDKALSSIQYLLKNESPITWETFQKAIKVYVFFAEDKADALRAIPMQDTVLWLYESAAIIYPDSAVKLLNNKGLKAYIYWQPRENKSDNIYTFYRYLFDISGHSIMPVNVKFLAQSVCERLNAKALRLDSALALYQKITLQTRAQIKLKPDAEAKEIYKESEKILSQCVRTDCNYVLEYLKPEYEKYPDSLLLAKRIMVLMQQHGCTTNPLYEKAALKVQEKEPSPNLLLRLGRDARKNKEYEKAITYFNKTILTTRVCEVKAECYLQIALVYKDEKKYELARKNAYTALSMNEARHKEVYSFIADLYIVSADNCIKNDNQLNQKLPYLLAYYYYLKSNNKIESKKLVSKLPTQKEIEEAGFKTDDIVSVACWINEKLVLKAFQ